MSAPVSMADLARAVRDAVRVGLQTQTTVTNSR